MWDLVVSFICMLFGACSDAGGCRVQAHAGVDHTICSYRVADISVKLFSRDANNQPYKSLRRLEHALDPKPLMLMNGGMFHEDLGPVGLYVENGDQRKAVSTKGGWGNFHLLPNGILWVDKGRIGVSETRSFLKSKRKVAFATQSGPMLVIDGKVHPKFIETSNSRKIRNGVGVSKDGDRVTFAISHGEINFWNFAKLFQSELNSHNALFLDGTVSAIRAPGFSRGGYWHDLGPMVGVFKR